MKKQKQYWRLLGLGLALGLGFVGLGFRLVDVQVLRHDELRALAVQNTEREYLNEPRRGDILDAKGNLLATSVQVKTVCADPVLIGTNQVLLARTLAPLLELGEGPLIQALSPRLVQNSKGEAVTNRFVRLKRKVPVETWEKIQSAMTNLNFGVVEKKLPQSQQTYYSNLRKKAIFARDDQLRSYPNQELAAHVIGYAGTEEIEVDDMPVTEIVGREGIEKTFDEKLAGYRGWRVTETDNRRRELVRGRDQDVEACDGLNVVLTIDSVIQHLVEGALADAMAKYSPISVSGLVIRPRTGEILAMATVPTFDPNQPGKATADQRRNRVITDIAEPGSTFKIVVVSGALNDRTVRLTDVFDCEHGRFAFAGRVLHDHEAYGPLSVQSIITKSSNIGAAKIGIKMGENRLYEYMGNYGFGVPTGIPLLGEVGGIVHPVKKWSKVSIAQIPMGHGVSVTRLQMTMAMCAIANNGWLMRPMLVDRLEDRDHRLVAKYPPQRVRQVISEAASKEMIKALKTVATPEGTAAKAALEHYTVAGKTGTAQKVENGRYVSDKFFASFIGFFPADNPELCISITMDEPDRKKGYYGGQAAAPVFKQIAEAAANYLNIRPEDDKDLQIPGPLASPKDERSLKTASTRPQ